MQDIKFPYFEFKRLAFCFEKMFFFNIYYDKSNFTTKKKHLKNLRKIDETNLEKCMKFV